MLRTVPWFTDDAVRFLSGYLCARDKLRVLEFGIGASTLFFADHASHMICFEHDQSWHSKVTGTLTALDITHVVAHLTERPYSAKASRMLRGETFDLISIDGRDRVSCLEEVLRAGLLHAEGILVLDNTERITTGDAPYARMLDLLAGFTLLHLEQTGPDRTDWQAPHRWITTIAWRAPVQYTTGGRRL